MSPRRLAALTVVIIACAGLVAGCSSDHGDMDMSSMDMPGMTTVSLAPVPGDAAWNLADVEFTRGMIVHHAQAVEMADLALANSSDPAVLALAEEIKAAQEPEIATFNGWLQLWGQPAPTEDEYDMSMMEGMDASQGGMSMGGMSMEGMVDSATMQRLADLTGPTFDTLFLESMIVHHEGAIDMAERVLTDGKDPEVAALAQGVIATQQREIDEMRGLLATQATAP